MASSQLNWYEACGEKRAQQCKTICAQYNQRKKTFTESVFFKVTSSIRAIIFKVNGASNVNQKANIFQMCTYKPRPVTRGGESP